MKMRAALVGIAISLVAPGTVAWDGWREVGGNCQELYFRSELASRYTFHVQFKSGAEKRVKVKYRVSCFCGKGNPRAVGDFADIIEPGTQSDVTSYEAECEPLTQSCSFSAVCSSPSAQKPAKD
jgi:hypothetical protein